MLGVAYQYPLLDLFWSMLMFFLFIVWIFILVQVIMDVFRSSDIGGGAKALWAIFIIFLPFLGVFIYLVARGHSMQERRMAEVQQSQEQMDAYIKETAGTSTADELAKLADLKSKGVITDADFEAGKAKLLR